ncbi:hypothetical protein HU200_046361 [Digitaria exilis]|uniref:Dehydrin n=1 Tax=Digitaria exilis TaxID=1010633 RepID=A0A835ECN2_9POAL|nr:hypothetical protein HU200_046361 [Digitaria exilis]CAB3474007.1 unnamed protein product [Digitaria exilis]
MAEYQGEYGLPYPRVDQYGNPVPPVDQYGNPVPREPSVSSGLGVGATADPIIYGAGDTAGVGYVAAPGDYSTAYPSGGVAPGETALAYEGMVGGGGGIVAATVVQPAMEEEHTFGSCQLQPAREEGHTTTLGEKLTRSGSSSSSSSSSEDDGQGGRRKKKSIKEKIKEKLPGTHKHEERKAATTTGTHAAGAHEKKGFMDKIKEKLPGHH